MSRYHLGKQHVSQDREASACPLHVKVTKVSFKFKGFFSPSTVLAPLIKTFLLVSLLKAYILLDPWREVSLTRKGKTGRNFLSECFSREEERPVLQYASLCRFRARTSQRHTSLLGFSFSFFLPFPDRGSKVRTSRRAPSESAPIPKPS